MLEQWEFLSSYFANAVSERRDPSYVTDSISQNLKNPFTKALLEFVQVQSYRTNKFNLYFWLDGTQLNVLDEKFCQLMKKLKPDFAKTTLNSHLRCINLHVRSKIVKTPTIIAFVGINASDTLRIVCGNKMLL